MARAAHEVAPMVAQDGSPRKSRKGATPAPGMAAGAPALVGTAAVKASSEAAFVAAGALRHDADLAARAAMDALRFTGDGVRGLTFERRWTRPGVHPYDEITWEIRTAAIGNESGKLVFEQKDVEVPAFWSQLATNVVVSKYFRGHLGTPERETSRPPADRPGRAVDHRLGGDAALLRDGRGPRHVPRRADPPPRPPEDELQLARSGSTSGSRRSRSARPASSTRSRTR